MGCARGDGVGGQVRRAPIGRAVSAACGAALRDPPMTLGRLVALLDHVSALGGLGAGLGATWSRSGVDLGPRRGVEAGGVGSEGRCGGSQWAHLGASAWADTWGRSWVDLRPVCGVDWGTVEGRLRADLRSTKGRVGPISSVERRMCGRFGVDPGSACGLPPIGRSTSRALGAADRSAAKWLASRMALLVLRGVARGFAPRAAPQHEHGEVSALRARRPGASRGLWG